MRLGQLARKLGIRPGEMIEFLSANNIQIEDESNTKIEQSHLSLLLQRFAPETEKNIVLEEPLQAETVITEKGADDQSDLPLEKRLDADLPNKPIQEEEEKVEVIKASKVELSGLKVLGKIDLPEPKKKQPELSPENETNSEAPKTLSEGNRVSNFKKRQTNQRPSKNPIALKREREALEAKEKRESEARLQKERRTQNYLKKVKSSQPTKAVKLVDEPLMEMSAAELAEHPKTWWAKFMKWLTN